jgi:hypothetical protein
MLPSTLTIFYLLPYKTLILISLLNHYIYFKLNCSSSKLFYGMRKNGLAFLGNNDYINKDDRK